MGIAQKRAKLGHSDEAVLMYVALGAVCMAAAAENMRTTRGVFVSAVMLMLTFYYLYLHTEHFKRDNLTGALNRMTFFTNLRKYNESELTAFCEFDLNHLKQINDIEGHAAGDEAIVTTARASVVDIREEFEVLKYSCAIGLAEWQEGKSFTEIYNFADDRMYKDKRIQKAKMKSPVREEGRREVLSF